MSGPRFDTAEIGRYYDRHTAAFIRFGQGGGAGVIHRAVWGPGTTTRRQAFHYVDDQIAGMARSLIATSEPAGAPHVVDLGCGVGASLCYLAERLPIRATGITLSPVQARLAAQRVRDAGLSGRVECIEADYCDLPAGVGRAGSCICGRVIRAWTRAGSLLRRMSAARPAERPARNLRRRQTTRGGRCRRARHRSVLPRVAHPMRCCNRTSCGRWRERPASSTGRPSISRLHWRFIARATV